MRSPRWEHLRVTALRILCLKRFGLRLTPEEARLSLLRDLTLLEALRNIAATHFGVGASLPSSVDQAATLAGDSALDAGLKHTGAEAFGRARLLEKGRPTRAGVWHVFLESAKAVLQALHRLFVPRK